MTLKFYRVVLLEGKPRYSLKLMQENASAFYGLAADRQEYCFTKDFFTDWRRTARSIVLQKIFFNFFFKVYF